MKFPQFFVFHFSLLILLSGCFTVSESEYPKYPLTQLPGSATNVTVTLRGFETTFIDTVSVHSFQSVFVPGYYGRHYCTPGYYQMVPTTTYYEQARASTMFVEQATDRMEAAGFNLRANPSDYIVEVRFEGPYSGERDPGGWRPLIWIGSLFTMDRDADTWKAKLKIYDNRNGRLLFTRDYQEEYMTMCFSLVPIFGPMSYDRTSRNYMQSWCLAALTDRLTSEASAFLSAHCAK